MREVPEENFDKTAVLIFSAGLLFASAVFIAAYIGLSRTVEDYLLSFIIAVILAVGVIYLFHEAALSVSASNRDKF